MLLTPAPQRQTKLVTSWWIMENLAAEDPDISSGVGRDQKQSLKETQYWTDLRWPLDGQKHNARCVNTQLLY